MQNIYKECDCAKHYFFGVKHGRQQQCGIITEMSYQANKRRRTTQNNKSRKQVKIMTMKSSIGENNKTRKMMSMMANFEVFEVSVSVCFQFLIRNYLLILVRL